MCIRNVLDGLMVDTGEIKLMGQLLLLGKWSDTQTLTGDLAGWPGVKLIHAYWTISTSSGDFGEKSWFLLIAWTLLCKYCHQASQKYLLPRVWRKVCSMADTNKFKVPCLIPASQVRFVTELQSTNTGPGADCWHPPPLTGAGGCLCLLQRSTNGQRRHGRQIGQLRSGSNIPALVGSLVDIWYLWSFIVIPHSPGDFIYPIRRVQSGLKLGTHFFGSS